MMNIESLNQKNDNSWKENNYSKGNRTVNIKLSQESLHVFQNENNHQWSNKI